MKPKYRALLMLAMVSFLLPMLQVIMVPRHDRGMNMLVFGEMFLITYALYWWYVADKRERQFSTGRLQDFGVILLSPVALPIYFVRSRGWLRGIASSLGAFGTLICMILLAGGGELVGRALGR